MATKFNVYKTTSHFVAVEEGVVVRDGLDSIPIYPVYSFEADESCSYAFAMADIMSLIGEGIDKRESDLILKDGV